MYGKLCVILFIAAVINKSPHILDDNSLNWPKASAQEKIAREPKMINKTIALTAYYSALFGVCH